MDLAQLRTFALSLPGVSESIACAGTTVESASFNVRRRAFLFISARDVRLKLGPSLGQAGVEPRARVGAHGWVTVASADLPVTMEAWVRESHHLVAGSPRRVSADAT